MNVARKDALEPIQFLLQYFKFIQGQSFSCHLKANTTLIIIIIIVSG